MTDEVYWSLLAIFCWVATSLAATAARVLVDFSAHELEQYCHRRNRSRTFVRIMESHDEVAASASIVAVLCEIGAIASFTAWWLPHAAMSWYWVWAVVAVLAMMAAQVWIPVAIAAHWETPFLFHTWRFWSAAHQVLAPLRALGRIAVRIAGRLAAKPHDDRDEEEEFEDEIRSMVTAGLHDGLLEADAREMIEGIIELGDVDVAEIMTPRSEIEAIDVNSKWDELMEFVIRVGRTRIPVYEGKLDRVVGILHAKDLLPELVKPVEERRSLRELVREAWFVPETKRVDELLREFRRTRKHMAIVLDEFQSVAGVVTIEDALEQIVGEIDDEYDDVSRPLIQWLNESTAEVSGRAPIDEVNEQVGLALPKDDEYDTIAGWIIHHLRRIPDVGEEVETDHAVIRVLESDGRSVQKVQVTRLAAARDERHA